MGPQDEQFEQFVQAIESLHRKTDEATSNIEGRVNSLEKVRSVISDYLYGISVVQLALLVTSRAKDEDPSDFLVDVLERFQAREGNEMPETARTYLQACMTALGKGSDQKSE